MVQLCQGLDVSCFEQQGVADVCAIKTIGGAVASVHEDKGAGKIFRTVAAFTIDVGIIMFEALRYRISALWHTKAELLIFRAGLEMGDPTGPRL